MMRFIIESALHGLCRPCLTLASTATTRQVLRRTLVKFNPVCTLFYNPLTTVRRIGTGWSLKNDTPLPIAEQSRKDEKIDLDIWKTVMRSQAIDETPEPGEKDDGEGDMGSEEPEASTLVATRELVVMWREAGKLVPEHMTDEEVKMLSELTTKSSRKKFLKFLAIKELHKKARKHKQEKKKAEMEFIREEGSLSDEGEAEGKGHGEHTLKNTFLLQVRDRNIDKVFGWRVIQAMQFDQPLVFDMSYEPSMSRRELENTVSQLLDVEAWNRRAIEPFHLHFCNLQPGGGYKRELLKRYGAEFWDRLLVTSTECGYVDLFRREDIVYLTADSPNVLHTFDHSKIYIVGALVDRSIQTGLSLANAKRLKLKTARLPLDQFLYWECGAKNLTLDQMIRILLTVKRTGRWEEALEFVPTRKHDGLHGERTEKRPALRSRNFEPSNGRTALVSNSKGTHLNWVASNSHSGSHSTSYKPKGDPRTFRKDDGLFGGGDRRFSPSDQGFAEESSDRPKSLTSRDKQSFTSQRTSLRGKMEERKMGRSKQPWWEDE